MKIKPIKKTLSATALTDPDPSFVSMCKGVGPANQEPFRAIRTEDPATPEEAAPMKMSKAKVSSAVAALAQTGYGVMQFQFDKTTFKTVDDVTQWLNDGGYSDFEIVERAKTFEVNDEDGRYEVGTVTPVPDAAPGVKAFVGKISGDEQVTEDDVDEVEAVEGDEDSAITETVEKTDDAERPEIDPAPRQRHAGSKGKPKKPVEDDEEAQKGAGGAGCAKPKKKDDADGGEPEVVSSDDDAAAAASDGDAESDDEGIGGEASEQPVALTEERIADLREKMDDALDGVSVVSRKHMSGYVISDIASAISSLRYVILDADYTGIDETAVNLLKTAAANSADALVAVANQLKGELSSVFTQKTVTTKTEGDQQVSEEAEDNTDAPAQADEAGAGVAQKSEPVDVAAIVAAAMTETVAKFEERIKSAEDKADAATAKAEKAEAELAERVEADESRSQSRKAADDLDQAEQPAKEPAKRCQASTSMLSAFGSRHARD